MNAIRETLLALFFAGWIIMIGLRVNTNSTLHLYNTQRSAINQENLHVVTDILEYDFRKIGHGLLNPLGAIQVADSNRIVFSYDKDPSLVYDSIRVVYKMVPVKHKNHKFNKILIRKENSNKITRFPFGISRFNLKYFNKFGKNLPTPVVSDSLASIREIEISLTLASSDLEKDEYGEAKYVTRIVPKNLLSHYD
ncbi:MAG: hypothetical protein GXO74_07300 [Calditrichaeota bacterium]|nr:hypothetical protein [Calditrichota bacterium]